jgi:hypothetical protein
MGSDIGRVRDKVCQGVLRPGGRGSQGDGVSLLSHSSADLCLSDDGRPHLCASAELDAWSHNLARFAAGLWEHGEFYCARYHPFTINGSISVPRRALLANPSIQPVSMVFTLSRDPSSGEIILSCPHNYSKILS